MTLRTIFRTILYLTLGGVVLVVGAVAWLALRPAAPWSMPVTVAGVRFMLPVADVLRVATHPYTARLLDGRQISSPYGPLTFSQHDNALQVHCAPCSVRESSLSTTPLRMPALDLTVQREDAALWGTLRSGQIEVRWRGLLSDQRLQLSGELPSTPAEAVYALFQADIPELPHTRIEGQIGGKFSLSLPDRTWNVQPDIHITRVSGLGTEALLGRYAPPRCAQTAPEGFGPRIAAAVIAAEDQRFWEHPGYDAVELAAALTPNRHQQGDARGASTLDEQVARLLYTGAQRSPTRKLRELMYAVEMDRTLGKPRILQLYLSLAPWGDNLCGAEAAAQHYFHKPAQALNAREAAWLASLLRNPTMAQQAPDKVSKHALWVLKWMKDVSPEERRSARESLHHDLALNVAGL